ncbi:(2Fe-2S)-binding protein [Pseudaestuariivita sp.]|uniref:(2Fe-2S)-binding protein n=1 Tax=Pseudaestuariivita sp. TaxID=2211669 RepID=UPI0040589F73
MAKVPVTFTLNDAETGVFVDPAENLLEALRRKGGDLSPKYGCGQGTCGACTVMVDGAPVLGCLTLAQTANGKRIDTTRGLSGGPDLHALQQCFMEGFAAQCGFCSPGMLVAAKALLDKNPRPTREDVTEAISGNLCRCTGYQPIVDAILEAANRLNGRTV